MTRRSRLETQVPLLRSRLGELGGPFLTQFSGFGGGGAAVYILGAGGVVENGLFCDTPGTPQPRSLLAHVKHHRQIPPQRPHTRDGCDGREDHGERAAPSRGDLGAPAPDAIPAGEAWGGKRSHPTLDVQPLGHRRNPQEADTRCVPPPPQRLLSPDPPSTQLSSPLRVGVVAIFRTLAHAVAGLFSRGLKHKVLSWVL